MNTDDLSNKIKDIFSKGAKVSKEAFEKAGDKVQEFSDKSVIRIEKKQLENKLEGKYQELGKKIADLFAKDGLKFNAQEDEESCTEILKVLEELKAQIKEKEDLLK